MTRFLDKSKNSFKIQLCTLFQLVSPDDNLFFRKTFDLVCVMTDTFSTIPATARKEEYKEIIDSSEKHHKLTTKNDGTKK